MIIENLCEANAVKYGKDSLNINTDQQPSTSPDGILEERTFKPNIKESALGIYPQLTHLLHWIVCEAESNFTLKT